jgi:porin
MIRSLISGASRRALGVSAVAVSATLWTGIAAAAPPPVTIPVDPDSFQNGAAGDGLFGFTNNLTRSNFLLGDMWGLRTWLSQYGMSLAVQETSEELGNVTGGTRQGAAYEGLTQAILQLDTQRAFGLYGGLANVSALYVHGRNLSADNLDTLQTASGIEADRSLRLWEMWYQQKFLDESRLDVKVGQQSLDQEFIVSNNAAYFVNTMFGWPMVPSADLPGGGPAYPLSALGVRFRWRPVNQLAILAGVFNGSPVSANASGDSQVQNPSGTTFPTRGGQLAIAELQYSYPALGNVVYPDQDVQLARLYRLGMWFDTENFADQRFDNTGLSLANPASTGIPAEHRGDYSIYAVADQMIWIWDKDANRNVSLFGRVMGTPEANRNLITLGLNAGLVMHQPLRYRNDDTFAVGMGYAKVSDRVAALDRDTANFNGSFFPIQHSETYVEATYQYQATPWWQLQPDLQYVFNPGGGIVDSSNPTQRVGNEFVIGLRTNILF